MFVAIRRLTILVIVFLCVLIATVLAYGNPEPIDLDLGFAIIEDVSLTVVLALTFALGAIFGVLFSLLTLVRHLRERHSLQRELRRARTELSNSRSLALTDAD